MNSTKAADSCIDRAQTSRSGDAALRAAVDRDRQGTLLQAIPSTLTPPIRLIPIRGVCEILGLKDSAVLAMAARGELPQKIKFGTSRRATARWVEAEIFAYAWALAAQRAASSNPQADDENLTDASKPVTTAHGTSSQASPPRRRQSKSPREVPR